MKGPSTLNEGSDVVPCRIPNQGSTVPYGPDSAFEEDSIQVAPLTGPTQADPETVSHVG
jgi:hypothetical protein